jgi:hypothetical protein
MVQIPHSASGEIREKAPAEKNLSDYRYASQAGKITGFSIYIMILNTSPSYIVPTNPGPQKVASSFQKFIKPPSLREFIQP